MVTLIALWLGIAALYLAIASAVGIFSRQAVLDDQSDTDQLVAAGYALAVFVPASALVLSIDLWPEALRIGLLILGGIALWAGLTRPRWLPPQLWQRPFAFRYLAGVMALAAVWGLGQAMSGSAAAPLLIAVSALVAGAAATGTAISS